MYRLEIKFSYSYSSYSYSVGSLEMFCSVMVLGGHRLVLLADTETKFFFAFSIRLFHFQNWIIIHSINAMEKLSDAYI